jgi:N6-adenosine-specific RNA methylase IME4
MSEALIPIGDPDLAAYDAGYAGVPPDVRQDCEQHWTAAQASLAEHLRAIRDALAPYGTFKDWCAGHGVDYSRANYLLNHSNWQPVLEISTARLPEPVDDLAREVAAYNARRSLEALRFVQQLPPEAHETLIAQLKAGTTAHLRGVVADQEKAQRLEANRQLVHHAAVGIADLSARSPFPTVVADPPWASQFERAFLNRGVDYQTEDDEQIVARFVEADEMGVFAPNCHLYLWATDEAIYRGVGRTILERLGFRWIDFLTWDKQAIKAGYYYRQQTERLYFAVRGSQPLLRQDMRDLFSAPAPRDEHGVAIHSAKPDAFYERVQECSPGPWVDLWGRKARPGWVCWGQDGIRHGEEATG